MSGIYKGRGFTTSDKTKLDSTYTTVDSLSASWNNAGTVTSLLSSNGTNLIVPTVSGVILGTHSGQEFEVVHAHGFHFCPTDTNPCGAEGSIFYDENNYTLTMQSDITGTSLQIGQESWIRVANKTDSQIDNGTIVYIASAGPGIKGAIPLIQKAKADSYETANRTIGVATHDIDIDEEGYVTTFGMVRGLNLDGLIEGSLLYLSDTTAGAWTTAVPIAPNKTVQIGQVIRRHHTEGILFANVERSWELYELNDTYYNPSTIQDGDLLTWNTTNTRWEAASSISIPLDIYSAVEDPTGFIAPENVTITGDPANRQITITGTIQAYYHGTLVNQLSSGWVSPVHGTDTTTAYFLMYNGSDYTWMSIADLAQDFYKNLLICWTFYTGTSWVYQRECHSVMQHMTHRELHQTVGTYKASGGTPSNYTLNSTTAANRRPSISQILTYDEDLPTTGAALAGGPYTQYYLSGAGVGKFAFADDIIPLNVNQPYYNQFNGTTWVQTPMTNNYYVSVWVVAVPMAADVESQKYRFVVVQGQSQNKSLTVERSLTPNSLTTGLPALTPESVFISRIIIRYQSGNWRLIEVENITGSGVSQVASPAGNYLSVVSTDDTINGDGTPADPLTLNPSISGTDLTLGGFTFTGEISSEIETLSASNYFIVDVGGVKKAVLMFDF